MHYVYFQKEMIASTLTRENDLLKEIIHINEILINLELQRKTLKAVNVNDDFFEVTWHEKHRDVYESLKLRKKQLHEILLSRL
jgi:hypothetical protein